MSANKWTPGPWRAGARTATADETEDRLGMRVTIQGGNAKDNRANAHLIASAPLMYAALEMSMKEVEALRDAMFKVYATAANGGDVIAQIEAMRDVMDEGYSVGESQRALAAARGERHE